MKPVIRKAYDDKYKSKCPTFEKETKTQQQFKDMTNINNIVAQYRTTGLMPHVQQATQIQYGDAPAVDYKDINNVQARSRNIFSNLPQEVRNRFGNDANIFAEFAIDPKNRQKLTDMGLIADYSDGEAETAAAPEVTQPVTEPETAPEGA